MGSNARLFDRLLVVMTTLLVVLIGVAVGVVLGRGGPAATAAEGSGDAGALVFEGELEVHAVDFAFDQSAIDVNQPGLYDLTLVNDGTVTHDLTLADGTIITAEPGESTTQRVTLTGTTDFWCGIPGHRDLGMEGTIAAPGESTVQGSGSGSAEGLSSPSYQVLPAETPGVDEISRHPTDLPDNADYTLYDDGTQQNQVVRDGPINHEVHFYIKETVAEVLPGTTMDYWTFDGAVPGPMIRGREGDTVDFFLHNPEDSSMPHNVDFHAVTGPGGGSVRLDTAPGAVSELKVKLLKPGIYIYHCAFPDIPTHIAHGMYGLVVVEPEGGLPQVDHEYYLMQSEFYTDRGGSMSIGQLENAGQLSFSGEYGNMEEPTFVVWNGRPNSITGDRTLGVFGDDIIQTGDTTRLFVGNIGPNLVSSFHVIGEIFDTVDVEGSFELQNHNVQTTLIPSGGAVGVEMAFEVPGDYLLVDHSIFRVHKGAAGIISVGGADRPDIYESVTYSQDLGGH